MGEKDPHATNTNGIFDESEGGISFVVHFLTVPYLVISFSISDS